MNIYFDFQGEQREREEGSRRRDSLLRGWKEEDAQADSLCILITWDELCKAVWRNDPTAFFAEGKMTADAVL